MVRIATSARGSERLVSFSIVIGSEGLFCKRALLHSPYSGAPTDQTSEAGYQIPCDTRSGMGCPVLGYIINNRENSSSSIGLRPIQKRLGISRTCFSWIRPGTSEFKSSSIQRSCKLFPELVSTITSLQARTCPKPSSAATLLQQ